MSTTWKQDGKAAFDKGWSVFEKLGGPVNRLSNKMGCEAFCPTTLDQECDKSARILKAFCGLCAPYSPLPQFSNTNTAEDGFYTEQPSSPGSSTGPKNKPKVLVKIPRKVIQNCVGLAIFTVMRTGMWISGAGGSGVLIARKEDGSWSPPSGLLVHTLGVGFMAGIDIYDCVVVINNRSALDAFSKVRVSLGGEVSVVAGPLGAGGILESEISKDRRPVFSYVKSRGLYAGAQLDGTVIVERNDENARFYGAELPIGDILSGNVRNIPRETSGLMHVLREIDGNAPADRIPEAASVPRLSDWEIQQMDEALARKLQMEDFQQAPDHGEPSSTNSLYDPPAPSPAESRAPAESSTLQSPTQGTPPLPPRQASVNGDSEKSKLG